MPLPAPITLFRRPSVLQTNKTTTCFFCQSRVTPRNTAQFKCPQCRCWNRFDNQGNIVSDDPAMHDESLNSYSFHRRASPNKDAIPTLYGPGPFCHTCQTNQMLLVNLLSNYLPEPEDPEYAQRLASLPEYRESLHVRYPPVCERCRPAVEDEIRRKDTMARAKALGGYLDTTSRRRVSNPTRPNPKSATTTTTSSSQKDIAKQIFWWKIRGVFWVFTLAVSLCGNFLAGLGYRLPVRLCYSVLSSVAFPAFVALSVLWTFWDWTFAAYTHARRQGRDVRITGKGGYNVLQGISFLCRLLTACVLTASWAGGIRVDYLRLNFDEASFQSRLYFTVMAFIEVSVLFASTSVLRLRQPPVVRLIDTKKHESLLNGGGSDSSRQGTPVPPNLRSSQSPAPPNMGGWNGNPNPSEADSLFSTLSLSSRPVLVSQRNANNHAVFGVPSFETPRDRAMREAQEEEEDHMDQDNDYNDGDAMDWTPTDPRGSQRVPDTTKPLNVKGNPTQSPSTSLWLRPQRFYAPEQPTGLEHLFERTTLVDQDEHDRRAAAAKLRARSWRRGWSWWWVYGVSLVPLAGAAWRAWTGLRRGGLEEGFLVGPTDTYGYVESM